MKKINLLILLISIIIFSNSYSQEVNIKIPKNLEKYEFKFLPPYKNELTDLPILSENFTLVLRDNATLDCSKFYPAAPNPYLPNGYPAVIMLHGYGDRKETLEGFARAQAAYGYVVYTYSMRGQGNSTGLSNLISTTEADDLVEFVNFVRTDFSTGLDTSKILIMGGSQGGMVPFMAASRGNLKVNSIIAAVASPEFATSWIENGSIKMTFLWTISYPQENARYTQEVINMRNWVYQSGTKNNSWSRLATTLPKNRDFLNIVSNNKIPILLENSWQDYFFNTLGNIKAIPLLKSNFRIYFGAVMGHGGDTSETENQWHMNFFNEWFYYYIWGIDNGILTRPRFHYAYTTYPRINNMWSFIHDSSSVWPISGVSGTKFYFSDSNKLNTYKTPVSVSTKYFRNNVIDNNLTMYEAVLYEFTGPVFESKFKKEQIYFETAPLTKSVKMIGTPKLNLKYRATANICQYNFQIFEVRSNGTVNMVTRLNYTDRNYTAGAIKTTLIDGISHAHIFQPGSKIRIVVTNLDTYYPQDSAFLETNPYVLPVLVKSDNHIYLRDSYIELPLVNEPTNNLVDNLNQDKALNTPTLEQNYPNPFNPTTNIRFTIPKNYNGLVTIKIYDMTGREVQQLLNQNMTSGTYEVVWNASNFASGVYFYQLVAGNYKEIRKMMLIK
ncbi:MAG: alpha/beta fold hydrolase [Ignavibacteria bacterium]|nr:alpha/beta fold hydrolase [Ignavibacteria bacterium]